MNCRHRFGPLARVLVLSLALAAVGCDDPAEGVTAAEVTAPSDPRPAEAPAEAPTEAPAEPAEREALPIDTASSTFGFIGSKVTASHEGHFETWSGEIQLAPGAIERSAVTMTFQTGTVVADSPRLTNHLRTGDFFDAETHPTATFRSTRIEPLEGAEGAATHRLFGEFEMRGVSRAIQFPVAVRVSPAEVRATARFTINRQQWGISYPGMADDLIRDDVVIHFDLRAPRG